MTPRRQVLQGILDEDDIHRFRMGRFSDADEHEMKRLVSLRDTHAVQRLIGGGVNPRFPAVSSSRPRTTSSGGQTFVFSHSVVVKGRDRGGAREVVFHAPLAIARGTGARLIRNQGGARAWVVPAARWSGEGTPVAGSFSTGFVPGTARAFQVYMERPGAVEEAADGRRFSIGAIAIHEGDRGRFWDAVEGVERCGGRVQQRIIAELPYETEVGADGRLAIVDRFGAIFDRLGLPWHAVVHVPGDGDCRNHHMHLAFHDRPVLGRSDDEGFLFAPRKSAEPSQRDFLPQLRDLYAEIVNDAYREVGIRRRFDPSRYADVGVAKRGGVHLGTAAAAAERKGIVTTPGRRAAAAEMQWRLVELGAALDEEARATERRLGAAAAVSAAALLEGREDARIVRLVEGVAAAAAEYIERERAAAVSQSRRTVLGWRDLDGRTRLERAAAGHEDAVIRSVAEGIAGDIRERFAKPRQAARLEALSAAAERDRAGRTLDQMVGRVEASLQVVRLERAERRLAVHDACPRRLTQSEWTAAGRVLNNQFEAAQRRVETQRKEALSVVRRWFGDKAPVVVAGVIDPRTRARTLRVVKDASPPTKGNGDMVQEVLARLIALLREEAEWDARRRRREAIEQDPSRLQASVMPSVVEATWSREQERLRQRVDELREVVLRNPLARRLMALQERARARGREGRS